MEIGTEAAQFPEKEYINGISFAVHVTMLSITDYGLRAYSGLTHGLTAILIFLMSMLPAIDSKIIV